MVGELDFQMMLSFVNARPHPRNKQNRFPTYMVAIDKFYKKVGLTLKKLWKPKEVPTLSELTFQTY